MYKFAIPVINKIYLKLYDKFGKYLKLCIISVVRGKMMAKHKIRIKGYIGIALLAGGIALVKTSGCSCLYITKVIVSRDGVNGPFLVATN